MQRATLFVPLFPFGTNAADMGSLVLKPLGGCHI